MMNKIQRRTAAILLGISLGMGYSLPAHALETSTVKYDGKPFMVMNYYGDGEQPHAIKSWLTDKSTYTLAENGNLVAGCDMAAVYWTNIIAANSKNTQPWQVLIFNQLNTANANAGTYTLKHDGSKFATYFSPSILEVLQDGASFTKLDTAVDTGEVIKDKYYVFTVINVGDNFGAIGKSGADNRGWYVNNNVLLCQNEQETDLVGCIRHELGHALGITTDINGYTLAKLPDSFPDAFKQYMLDTKLKDGSQKYTKAYYFYNVNEDYWNNSWNDHLYDQNGHNFKDGAIDGKKLILTNDMLKTLEGTDYNSDNCFIVDDASTLDAKKLAEIRVTQPTYGYAFFKGDHVSEVLDGKTFQGVDGLPINGWEYENSTTMYAPEFSHIQLPVLMSHRNYCSYTSFTEVELAVMQDMGYKFDRKAYFGRSIYNDNLTITNEQGYSARNADGTAYLDNVYSDVSLGLGLHVYGSHNTITQAADLITKGDGAAGMRVDGIDNKLIIAEDTNVRADGKNGVGIMVAYGKDHVLEQKGTVTALGENGNAVQFDFGSSSNGASDEYRGSYIRYGRKVNAKDGAIVNSVNYDLKMLDVEDYCVAPDELDGALVNSYNVEGKLEGAQNAIYIGRNAFVREINLLAGAEVKGNITSDWKHFSEDEGIYATGSTLTYVDKDGKTQTGKIAPLDIQYKGYDYNYTQYIPDLVTQLNVDLGAGAAITYIDKITGTDNIRLNVQSGTFNFTGEADILGVSVDKDATLIGGSYTLHDMTSKMAEGFTDSNASGVFVNSGTIGAARPTDKDTALDIKGKLRLMDESCISFTGNVVGDEQKIGIIKVEGDVTQGRKLYVEVDSEGTYKEGTYSVLKANDQDVPLDAESGRVYEMYNEGKFMGADYNANDGKLTFKLNEESTVLNKEQTAILKELNSFSGLTKVEKASLADVTCVDLYKEKEKAVVEGAISELKSDDNAQLSQTVQSTNLTSRMIGSRLAGVNAKMVAVPVKVVPASLDNNKDAAKQAVVTRVDVKLESENRFWGKVDRTWGNAGSIDAHNTAYTLGYDKKYNEDNRFGVLFSYADSTATAAKKKDNMKDYRLALYNGYHKAADDVYVYLDYGKQRHTTQGRTVLMPSYRNDYNSQVLELGAEYKHDLHSEDGKIFHISPYVNGQVSRMWQDGYKEGALGQNVHAHTSNYAATELGLEVSRYFAKGGYSARLGYKEVWAGATTSLNYSIGTLDFTSEAALDKHFVTASLCGNAKIDAKWSLAGDAHIEKGAHDKNYGVSAMLKYEW